MITQDTEVATEDMRYSNEALASRALLYSGLNDINLYVEDTDKEYEYETIFRRLLGDKYCIKTIFPLGGKPKVKQQYKEFGSETDGIKNFYIVDGDFDRYISPNDMICDDCFIYLKTYNIENYYIDENACLTYAKGCLKQIDKQVQQRIDFNLWKTRIVSEAKKLFLCYCYIQLACLELENVNRSPYLFLDQRTGFERTDGAFEQYSSEIQQKGSDMEKKIKEISIHYEEENGQDLAIGLKIQIQLSTPSSSKILYVILHVAWKISGSNNDIIPE